MLETERSTSLGHKFDAVGYGIFIPIFFITSGMTLDLKAISQDPLRLLVIFVSLLAVRALPPQLIYRRALPLRQRAEMTFVTATTLPLLIALADIGEQDGVMLLATVAAMIGAGVLSVLVYPVIAVMLHRSAPLTPADIQTAAQTATGTSPRAVKQRYSSRRKPQQTLSQIRACPGAQPRPRATRY